MRDDVRHPWREAVRSLWFLPTVFIVAALAAGYGLSRIEVAESGLLDSLTFRGSATAARELLIVVSGTMITVTGLVFVLTVVALQIASTQFSPRLLRSFLQDPGTRLVLSVFVATFSYSLGGLFTVGQTTDAGDPFVPRLAVTGSLMLALVSVGMLVYYIQHITNSIRIDTVMLGVRRATIKAIRTHYPEPEAGSKSQASRPIPPAEASLVTSSKSGYVQEIDVEALIGLASAASASIWLRSQVGHHVVAGTPLAWVWSEGQPPALGLLGDGINQAVVRAHERRVDQDVGFGIRQLVDIGLRAVSPSINDPYTAVQAIQHLSVLVAELTTVATDDTQRYEAGRLLLYVPVPNFDLFVDLVCTSLRRTAGNRPRVMIELLRLLETAAVVCPSSPRRAIIGRHVDLVLQDAERSIEMDADLESVRKVAVRAARAAETGSMAIGD